MDLKINFTKANLEQHVLELTKLQGYERPSTYLNDLLKKVKSFDDIEFTYSFYLNVRDLCREHQEKFWSEEHKSDITNWLRHGPIVSIPLNSNTKGVDFFNATWTKDSSTILSKPVNLKFKNAIDRLSVYGFNDYHRRTGLTAEIINNIISECHDRKAAGPYFIAFINATGYWDHLVEKEGSKAKAYIVLEHALEMSQRRVKGNVNVLNPISREDKDNYTSHMYLNKIVDLISNEIRDGSRDG